MPSGMDLRNDRQGANQRGRISAAARAHTLARACGVLTVLLFLLSVLTTAFAILCQFRDFLGTMRGHLMMSGSSFIFLEVSFTKEEASPSPLSSVLLLRRHMWYLELWGPLGCHTWGMVAASQFCTPQTNGPQSCSSYCYLDSLSFAT